MEEICGNNTYRLGEDTIMLPVAFSWQIPKEIQVSGEGYSLKTEFHVSLVCIGKVIEKHNITIPDFREKVVSDFCEFTRDNDLSRVHFKNKFKQAVEKGGEIRSVLIMCDVPNLVKFYEVLNVKYGLALECQPTHVSLFTIPQGSRGVFLIDSEDIRKLTKEIAAPFVWPIGND